MTIGFEQTLRDTASRIEALLDGLLCDKDARAPRVISAMRYAALGGGKRIRPFLVTECARLADGDQDSALRTAAALECVHCYSLVHDDLPAMDDDDMRRGRPATHVAFDEATAILAGDGLLTLAFEILTSPETHPDPEVRVELIRGLALAAGASGMVGGQMLDLAMEKSAREADDVIAMQRLKTGMLIEYACRTGAILGGANDQVRNALSGFAANIGLAFQVADDLLDAEGSADDLGKRAGKDADAGKATFVSLLGVSGARDRANALIDAAIRSLDMFDDRADILRRAAAYVVERRT